VFHISLFTQNNIGIISYYMPSNDLISKSLKLFSSNSIKSLDKHFLCFIIEIKDALS